MGSMLFLAAGLSGVAAPQMVGQTAGPAFSPIDFFSGNTAGEGVFRRIAARHRAVHVRGRGTVRDGDTILLDQRVEVSGKPPRDRRWTLHALGDGRYTGVLSEAVGPVTGEVRGSVFKIRFHAKGGFRIQQTMRLQPDGRTVENHLVVRKFGIRVAVLDETIRKLS